MVNWKSKRVGDLLWFTNALVVVVLINLLVSKYFFRIDLTEEKRYSIKSQTRTILEELDDDVYIEVYLDGELNAAFTRFQKSILETLEEFRIYSDNKVHVSVIDPMLAVGEKARSEFMTDLAAKGIQPTNVVGKENGQRVEKIIFPGVVIAYGGMEKGVMLLKGNKAQKQEEEINQSIEGVEFELINAIYTLATNEPKRVGWVTGHGELDSMAAAGFQYHLREAYSLDNVTLTDRATLTNYNALIIAKPTKVFSVLEKYNLDQYIMQGGRVMFMVDKLEATMDSASREDYFAFPYPVNLDDQLFKYGARINLDLIQDNSAALYPVVVGESGGKPKFEMMRWPFFPLINHYADHPVTRNLDAVVTKFISSMDTVKAEGIKKTPLLFTSDYTRVMAAPVNVSANDLRTELKPEDFPSKSIPVSYLLEGSFTSLYKNRYLPAGVDQQAFNEKGIATKLIVIGDGDLARNDVNPRTGRPQPLGLDPFTNYTFANRDLLMNAVAFLTEENGLIQARNKQVKIRPLNRERVNAETVKWKVINVVLPLVLLVAYGLLRAYWRRKTFARF